MNHGIIEISNEANMLLKLEAINRMKRAVVFVIAMLCLPQVLWAQSALDRTEVNRLSNTVVQILTFEGDEPLATGSGIIVAPTGVIYTNRHVIEDGTDFGILILEDINEQPVLTYFASLNGVSSDVDFAVLQIDRDADGNPLDSNTLELPFLTPTTPEVQRGDPIFVFGYPGIGDGYLVFTEGTITTIQNGTVNNERLPIWYQTDAEIAPGNSGGLVVNSAGEFVGIPTIVRSEGDTGGRLGGILPISAALSAIDAGLQQASTLVSVPRGNGQLDYRATPTYGSVRLESGFRPDPYSISVISGGGTDASYIGDGCLGFAASPPDFRLYWTGRSEQLRILFNATNRGDSVLIISNPSGTWICNDDANNTTRNPMVSIDNPPQGQYDIWIASYEQEDYIDGTLLITELNQNPN